MVMNITTVQVNPSRLNNDMMPVIEWLEQHVGRGVLQDVDAWRLNYISWSAWVNIHSMMYVFEFRRAEDALLFSMRWT
jgi:hypothetical protein